MKKLMKVSLSILAVVLMLQISTVTTLADSSEAPKEEDTSTETKEDTSTTTKTKALTPDGNLTLVDDIKTKDTNEKEFLTVVSKSGNYFYIIVDRADNGEMNVHFLNLVDEKDLLDLIDEETKEPEPEPIIIEPTPTEEPVIEEEPKKSKLPGIIALLAILGLAGGGAFYYFNYLKPNQSNGNPDDLDDLDWDDEDEEDFDDNITHEDTNNQAFNTVIEEQEHVDEIQKELFEEEDE